MRINRKVILKILKLDKNIYNELASEPSNFQIAIAIYVSGFLLSGIAILSFFVELLCHISKKI